MQNQRLSGFVSLVLLFALAASASLVLNSKASAQSVKAWTAAGSTGTIDEDSLSISQVRNFTVTLQPGAVGTVRARYNITPTEGLSRFCPATTSQVRVRFRNSDNTGVTARVAFEIKFINVLSGSSSTTLYTFNSDGIGLGSSFTTFTNSAAPIDFDFAQNVYWIDATIFRSNAGQFADLGSIQIFENAGTTCP